MKDFNPKKPAKGLGDSIAKVTHALGIDKVAEGIAHALGKEDCGCDRRRMKLNELVSYVDIPKEQYNFTDPTLFEVLQCFNIDGISYNQGEKFLVDPSRPIYYCLKRLLVDEKIKPYAT